MKLCYYMVCPYDINHVGFLYLLLSKRQEHENISHTKMPSFSDHHKFVESNPYFVWWIIQLHDDNGTLILNIGSLYITDKNEIGIHLLPEYQNQGYGKEILNWIAKEYYSIRPLYANINPANEKSIKLFSATGFKQVQVTYRLD